MDKYLERIKEQVLKYLEDDDVTVVLFGSRARNEFNKLSDVDIGIIPKNIFNKEKIVLLKELIENMNVPYKVDLVDFSNVSNKFKKEALKEAVSWKD